ncbi:MAG: hypothetical protein HY873_06030 [Chloroflexi bacterium]|nr:hypothetical protein [Chloroflexota bacterium]
MLRAWGSLPAYPRRVLLRLAFLPAIAFVLFNGVFFLLEVLPDPYGSFGGKDSYCRQFAGQNPPECHATSEKYGDFWQRIFTLDFGKSYVNNRPVSDSIEERWVRSAELLILSVLFSVATACVAGLWPSLRRRGAWSSGLRVAGALIAAAPMVALLTYQLIYPQEWWGYAPPLGGRVVRFFDHPVDNLQQFVPAAFTVGVLPGMWSARLVRRISGPAPIPLIRVGFAAGAVAVDVFPWVLGALLVVESIYTIPGLGEYLFRSLYQYDVSTSEAVILLFALLALVVWALRPPSQFDASIARHVEIDWRWTRHNCLLVAGATFVLAYVIIGIIGPWIAPHEAREFVGKNNEGASLDHLLGTDKLGRDIFSRLLYGNRTSLELSATILAAGFVPGLLAGSLLSRGPAGFRNALMEAAEIWLSMPLVIISLMFVVAFWPGFKPLAICFGIHAFMLALRAGGHGFDSLSVTSVHHWVPALGAAAIAAAATILGETTVGFLALGIPHEASWGGDMSKARESLPYHHWAAWSPFVAVLISASGFFLIRTALDDVDPPRMYER